MHALPPGIDFEGTGIDDMSRVTSASREAVEVFMQNVDIGAAATKDSHSLNECITSPFVRL